MNGSSICSAAPGRTDRSTSAASRRTNLSASTVPSRTEQTYSATSDRTGVEGAGVWGEAVGGRGRGVGTVDPDGVRGKREKGVREGWGGVRGRAGCGGRGPRSRSTSIGEMGREAGAAPRGAGRGGVWEGGVVDRDPVDRNRSSRRGEKQEGGGGKKG